MEIPVYARYQWWVKWFAVVVITDEGVFAEDEVPEDYGGPQLTTEIIQRVVFATDSGYMWEHRYDDSSTFMDKNRQTGMGVDIEAFESMQEAEHINATGPSTRSMTWHGRENPVFSEERAKLLAIAQKALSTFL